MREKRTAIKHRRYATNGQMVTDSANLRKLNPVQGSGEAEKPSNLCSGFPQRLRNWRRHGPLKIGYR